MNKQSRKHLVILVAAVVLLLSSCQGTSVPATPDVNALAQWGDKNSSAIIKERLGKGPAYALALSPDGKTIAVTGLLYVSLYDFKSLKEIWTSPMKQVDPQLSTWPYGNIVWSPDGSQLATLSQVGISVWDAKTGKLLSLFREHEYRLNSISWAQDGSLLATEFNFGRMTLLDAQTGVELFNWAPKEDLVTAHDWMLDGSRLAVGLGDGKILVQDTQTRKQIYPPLKACDGFCVNSLKWSPNGTRLASASQGMLLIWDAQTGKQLFSNDLPQGKQVSNMAWSPNNNYLAVAFYGGILIWSQSTGEYIHTIEAKQILTLAWSPDEKSLISLDGAPMSLNNEGVVNVWDVQTGEKLRSLKEDRSPVSSLAWSPDGKTLASGLENGDINIWEVASGKKLQSLHDPKGIICSVDWSPDGKKLVSGGRRTIVIWEAETGEQIQTLGNQTQQDTEVVWSPNGSLLASISYQGYNSGGIIWDASTGEKLLTLKGNEFTVGISWSPEGDLLGTSYPSLETEGEQVTLWNPETGEAVITKVGLSDVAWSPTGNTIASIFDNGTIELWDAHTGNTVKRITPGIFIYQTEWSPDGNYLVLAQDDERSLIVLNAQSGEQLHVLKGHADSVRDIEWSPSGDLIATASMDGTVIIWEIDAH